MVGNLRSGISEFKVKVWVLGLRALGGEGLGGGAVVGGSAAFPLVLSGFWLLLDGLPV